MFFFLFQFLKMFQIPQPTNIYNCQFDLISNQDQILQTHAVAAVTLLLLLLLDLTSPLPCRDTVPSRCAYIQSQCTVHSALCTVTVHCVRCVGDCDNADSLCLQLWLWLVLWLWLCLHLFKASSFKAESTKLCQQCTLKQGWTLGRNPPKNIQSTFLTPGPPVK